MNRTVIETRAGNSMLTYRSLGGGLLQVALSNVRGADCYAALTTQQCRKLARRIRSMSQLLPWERV